MRPAPDVRRAGAPDGFVLYLEGPRDRDLLRTWAARLSAPLGRAVALSAFILGGRQPARAVLHFREAHARGEAERGLVVLDRDEHGPGQDAALAQVRGLELFTWGRRHIESYLLVPAAIRRSLRIPDDDARARSLRDLLPDPADEAALASLDAKRFLARHGPLARAVGTIAPGRIARAMRPEEFHADLRRLLERLRAAYGLDLDSPQPDRGRRGGRRTLISSSPG
jgi:hypothetical protein